MQTRSMTAVPSSPAASSPQRRPLSTVNSIAPDTKNVGVVAQVASLPEFVAAAGRIVTKGAILDRGGHDLEAAMHAWVNAQDEPMESFATEEVFHPSPGDEIEACTRLTAHLPGASGTLSAATRRRCARCCCASAPKRHA